MRHLAWVVGLTIFLGAVPSFGEVDEIDCPLFADALEDLDRKTPIENIPNLGISSAAYSGCSLSDEVATCLYQTELNRFGTELKEANGARDALEEFCRRVDGTYHAIDDGSRTEVIDADHFVWLISETLTCTFQYDPSKRITIHFPYSVYGYDED